MDHYNQICVVIFIFFLYGCSPSSAIQLKEVKVEPVSIPETIHINNCNGESESEQIVNRFFTVIIAGFENDVDYQNLEVNIRHKYKQYEKTKITHKVIVPPGTDMEFNLTWSEEIHSGTIKMGINEAIYNVRIPISVEQLSSNDLGCPNLISTPTRPMPLKATDIAKPSQTNTINLDGTMVVTPTVSHIAKLGFCTHSIRNNCIYSIHQAVNKSLSLYFNLAQSGIVNYYLLFDGVRYEIQPIAGYKHKYVCLGFPANRINQTVFIQIFTSESSVPLAEGNIFLDITQILPTATPKHPNPYRP